jgi:hypothetical protein
LSKIQTKKTLFPQISNQYQLYLKQFKKKKFYFKAKFVLTVILPIFIFMVFIKAAQTFIRIKIRNLFAKPVQDNAAGKTGVPVSVQVVPVETETLHLQKVSEEPR